MFTQETQYWEGKPIIIDTPTGPHVLVEYLIDENGADSCDAYHHHISKATLWERKVDELGDRFLDSINKHGIRAPILYTPNGKGYIKNGHHRIVCAWLLGIEYLPFVYDWNSSENHAYPESTS